MSCGFQSSVCRDKKSHSPHEPQVKVVVRVCLFDIVTCLTVTASTGTDVLALALVLLRYCTVYGF